MDISLVSLFRRLPVCKIEDTEDSNSDWVVYGTSRNHHLHGESSETDQNGNDCNVQTSIRIPSERKFTPPDLLQNQAQAPRCHHQVIDNNFGPVRFDIVSQ
ncbi:hypothetical protein Dimus_003622 [Dionaea muscipula]